MGEALPYIIVGIPLGVIVLYAFWLYCRSEAEISFGTWFILAYGDVLDFGTYFGMTEKWWMNIVPLCFAVGSIATFVYALFQQRFGKIRRIDVFCIAADLAITGIWSHSMFTGVNLLGWMGPWFQDSSASTIANLAYQGTSLIAFVPTWLSQVSGEEPEPSIPWFLWAFVCAAFTVVVAYGHGMWEELAYPVTNLFTHTVIAVATLTARARYCPAHPRRA